MILRPSIHALMAPSVVAVVGASTRERAMGNTVLRNFRQMDFEGRLLGVHPRESHVEGVECFPSIADLPEVPDVAVIALRRELVIDAVIAAGQAGTSAAVVFASGLGETRDGAELALELQSVANAMEMSITGPNCMGLVNVRTNTPLYSSALPLAMIPGNVALVSQSGSGCIAMICSGRLDFSFIISAGNELVTTGSDYLEYFAADPHTQIIAMIVETIRDPESFACAADKARRAGKPVIVLKAGSSILGQRAAAAHTGALIAPADEYEAFFRRHGIIPVHDFDEMIETALLLGSVKSKIASRRVGFVSLSGGENAILLDGVAGRNVDFPAFAANTEQLLKNTLPDFASISNPLDATGTAVFDKQMYKAALEAVEQDDSVDFVGVIQDAPPGLDPGHQESVAATLRVVAEVAGSSSKPFAVLSNVGGAVHSSALAALSQSGVPFLTGTREGLLAIEHYMDWSTMETWASKEEKSIARGRPITWTDPGTTLATERAFDLIASYGIHVVEQRFVRGLEEAIAATDELGYPLAVKGAAEAVLHKTERGLVHLNIGTDHELRVAVESIEDELGSEAEVVLQEMVEGIEVILGARISPTFGPIVVLGVGGVFVELIKSTATELAPLTKANAEAMIDRTIMADLLTGYRGGRPADRDALSDAVRAFGQLVWHLRKEILEIEINPLVVLREGQGLRAVDVLVTRKED